MENINGTSKEDEEQIELPPGFRFHPTDEELITHYLSQKVLDSCFCSKAIGEVDLNKCEPWDLPWRAKMGENEWYFFCVGRRKYPNGLRTNRATDAGYWKATGKDKEIYREKSLVGMKKTLVFYKGRAPKGEKTNWVMHEYRLEGKFSVNYPKSEKNEWVVCRAFKKSNDGKKTHISRLGMLNPYEEKELSSLLPPFMDSSSHVPCFSNQQDDMFEYCFDTPFLATSSSSSNPSNISYTPFTVPESRPSEAYHAQFASSIGKSQDPDSFSMQNEFISRMFLENQGSNSKHYLKEEIANGKVGMSIEDQSYHSSSSAAPLDLDCLWNY